MEFCDKGLCGEHGDEVVGIFTSYFVGTWFEFFVCEPAGREIFVSFFHFLCIQESSVVAVTYRKIGHVHVLRPRK